jgi:hypothetical protein
VKILFALVCAGAAVAVGWALWVGKDDMRRYKQMREM